MSNPFSHTKYAFLLLFVAVGAWCGLHAQSDTTANKEPEGIVYDSGEEADSILPGYVYMFHTSLREVKLYRLTHPLLDPTGVQMLNATHRLNGLYFADLGALGQVQASIIPFSDRTLQLLSAPDAGPMPVTMTFQADVHPVYHSLHRENMFQTQKPYTLLGYGSSLNKDYQINIVHTQNIQPRWNVAFCYDLVSRNGLYTNSEVTNHILDATTNYYSEDARYQVQAELKFNRMRQQENGGVANDTNCWNYSRESGVPVNMYAAQNQWREIEIGIHQSFNTVRQFYHIRPIIQTTSDSTGRDTIVGYDTIMPHKPRTFNTGVFALDVNFSRHRRIFSDGQSDGWFYSSATLDTTFWFDSTAHNKLSGELYWTNDAYMHHRWSNPLAVTLGVRSEYNMVKYALPPNNEYRYTTFSPFAHARFNLGKFHLVVAAEEVNGGLQSGDYSISAAADIGGFRIAALSEARTPDFMYLHYHGLYNWDNEQFDKTNRQQLAANYHYDQADSVEGFLRLFDAKVATTLIKNNIWLDDNMNPTQSTASGLLSQMTLMAHLRFGWFNIRMQQMLMHSTDDDVVRVPLFASKNSLYADLSLFHHALRLQTGFDLRYHTRYKADAWNPVIGTFYRQDNVEIGNYLVADFWVNLQIKRASIYLKASHFNAPLEKLAGLSPNYFSLPHYPMEGFGLYWGVIWKFFN